MIQQILWLFSLLVFCAIADKNNLKLKQVLVLSRHNIRTPIRPDILSRYSPKKWPLIHQPGGQLTQRGALMEGYMARYFMDWFKSEQFLQEECPSVYVYANALNRTVKTAEAFVESAFESCNVTVHHRYTTKEVIDPIFSAVIRNTTDAFRDMVFSEINRKLDNPRLKLALLELNKILDIENSELCQRQSICDLADMSKSHINFKVGHELWVFGPLYVASTVVDSFAMSYYDGLPLEDVAWGHLRSPEQWKILTEVNRQDQDIRYTTVAKDTVTPLMNYIADIYHKYDDKPKFILIVGHDFNQNAFVNSMEFKPFRLRNTYDLHPIGGKIVFQRWTDNDNDYLKIEYIYPTWRQLRNGVQFSMKNPPQRQLLQLKWCKVDENGFCPWNEFVNKLGLMY